MKKLTSKQKKLYASILVIIIALVLAFATGKDIKQVVSNLFSAGVEDGGLDAEDLSDALKNVTPTVSLEVDDEPEDTPTPKPTATNTPAPTATTAPTATPEPTATTAPTNTPTPEPTKSPADLVEEDGVYSTPELVAAYIHTYNKLPSNYITKNEATKLGWVSSEGNLWDVTDEMSIGGDKFGNYEGLLPKANGRQWYECDVNYYGGYRGSERILYSNDGLIYYTEDHYESFTQLY
ncbi:MAG: ribonuclease [Lachnospiraceae bacterium]|nr:ribonuclease [Lachnospiraceae bacterium]